MNDGASRIISYAEWETPSVRYGVRSLQVLLLVGLVVFGLGPIIWLALAALQLQRKELQPNVREHALAVIDSGADLSRWEAEGKPEDIEGRKRVLEELKSRLVARK